LEEDQLQRLFEEVPKEWKLFVRLLVFSGCRISEFLALTWADFDEEAGTIIVNKRIYQGEIDVPKSPYGVRAIPLTRELCRELANGNSRAGSRLTLIRSSAVSAERTCSRRTSRDGYSSPLRSARVSSGRHSTLSATPAGRLSPARDCAQRKSRRGSVTTPPPSRKTPTSEAVVERLAAWLAEHDMILDEGKPAPALDHLRTWLARAEAARARIGADPRSARDLAIGELVAARQAGALARDELSSARKVREARLAQLDAADAEQDG
jgi:integrase